MSWTGRHILVLGAGRSGLAAARLLLQAGARVALYDRDPAALRSAQLEVERFGGSAPPDLDDFDGAVASPGIALAPDPRLVPEIDLAAEFLQAPIVGVTGTNGKSTSAVLIARMLRESGLEVAVGGNIGTPLASLASERVDWIVAELSSFQLEHARELRARVGVLLNLAPDHLDRHGDLPRYGAAKARLATLQTPEDTLVVNGDDEWAISVGQSSRAGVVEFSQRRALADGAFLDGSDLVLAHEKRELLRMAERELAGACRAPIANALAAATAARAAGASPDGIRSALAHFEGLPHRSELVCRRRGVAWIDDSKATNPAAAVASLAARSEPVWWLAGGRNKDLDFAALAAPARALRGAILYGEAAPELSAAVADATAVVRVESLDEAVAAAAVRARSGEVVLLSPACASFDQFASFEERGDRFAELARALPC